LESATALGYNKDASVFLDKSLTPGRQFLHSRSRKRSVYISK